MIKKSKENKAKILIILGATATGKSALAVKLAQKFNGEIISADSRQVYKGLDIGTGKITKKEMNGVSHHLLNVVSPKQTFTVAEWQKQAEEKIKNITHRRKLPIICGGTGFYIQSIVDGLVLPEVSPNIELRKKLEKKNLSELQKLLKKLDPLRFKNIDKANPARLIRAIEIAKKLGNVPKAEKQEKYNTLQIGLEESPTSLKKKITERLQSRMKEGMVGEAERLHKNRLSWKRMRKLGLEYRYLADYLENKITEIDLLKKLETEIWRYAKRQMTWFKRDKRIRWFNPKEMVKILKQVDLFLK